MLKKQQTHYKQSQTNSDHYLQQITCQSGWSARLADQQP